MFNKKEDLINIFKQKGIKLFILVAVVGLLILFIG